MIVAVIASMMTLSAQKQTSDRPAGERVVLKAAVDFDAVEVNAPVMVELIKDTNHPGLVVYHTTADKELKVYSKGRLLVIEVDKAYRNKTLHVSSRVAVCYAGDVNSVTVNGSGTLLVKNLDVAGTASFAVNGSGDLKINSFSGASISASVNGSGDLDIKKCTVTGSAALTVNGSGDVDIDLIKAQNVSASVNGSGDLEVKGSAVSASLELAGSGDLKAGSLQVETATVTGVGSGDIYCRASKSLSVDAARSCDVHVRGPRPANVDIKSENVHFAK